MNLNPSDQAAEIAAKIAAQLVAESLARIYAGIADYITVKRSQYFENFTSYCNLTHSRNSLVRTLYSKNKPVPLDEVYVQTRFSLDDIDYTEDEILRRFSHGDRIIVKGNGGSGKTVFLRHLWISRFRKPDGRIPIFVELRRFNDLQKIDILTFCKNELSSDSSFGKGVFEKLCEAGKFEFIFDGFDEVSRVNRKQVERQIISLAEKYRKCCFLVSGREDDRFSSWGAFQVFSVSPMTLDDAKEMIGKIPFDRKVKKKFLGTLTAAFYSQHKSFLSNPLLAIMMLMTFNENAIIPSKLTEFYRSAFQTLLTWHDATKDSFERDRSLSVDQFRKIFATFCLLTYYEQAFQFDEESLRGYFDRSLRYHLISADLDDVKSDICESANLLQKDGLKFVFVHRSFQEYFAAECAMQVISGKAGDFLEVFSKRTRDTVFAMCYEIHPELVIDEYFVKKLDRVRETTSYAMRDVENKMHFWLCELAWMECRVDDVNFFHPVRASIESSEWQNEFMRIVRLASEVTGTSLNEAPIELMFHLMFNSVRSLEKDFKLDGGNDHELKVQITFEGRKYKVSVRNIGEDKLSPSEMRKLRAKLVSSITSKLGAAEEKLKSYFFQAQGMFEKMIDERSAKEKSIDEILGL